MQNSLTDDSDNGFETVCAQCLATVHAEAAKCPACGADLAGDDGVLFRPRRSRIVRVVAALALLLMLAMAVLIIWAIAIGGLPIGPTSAPAR